MRPALAFSSLALACAGALFSTAASASCYVVYSASQQVLYRSTEPPVNLSYQLHQTVPYRYGQGATMVFGIADANCGPDADPYYDLKPTQVVYREGRAQRVRPGQRAPRRDRE